MRDVVKGIPAEYMALCPLDGRYSNIGEKFSEYFSEYALVKNRVRVEVLWLKFLLERVGGSDILDAFAMERLPEILAISEGFSKDSFKRIKVIESVTNHDVKAVEFFVAEKLKELGLDSLVSYVHIGCTSEDINNTAYATMISTALSEVWVPAAEKLIYTLASLAGAEYNTPMLAHTHGQPATPTTVGKELGVFVYRLEESLKNIESIKIRAKFNGATGTYAAIATAFPLEDWPRMSKLFVEKYLGLDFNPVTTQIEPHDYICHLADGVRHFNNVLADLDVDMWQYISMEYFKLRHVAAEVGSSTMPHKVNPINFENSESNVDTSNALFMALSNKLPRSRMQRDLSDSSSMRNIGVAFGYSLQAITQTTSGILKVSVNYEKVRDELVNRWEVLAEPIQTVLRVYGIPDAYNRLKELTRGKQISKEIILEFVKSLDEIPESEKRRLLALTPSMYTGYASSIAEEVLEA